MNCMINYLSEMYDWCYFVQSWTKSDIIIPPGVSVINRYKPLAENPPLLTSQVGVSTLMYDG